MKSKVSIIIPSYQSANTIVQTLESLHRQQTDFAYEIIVVNSSADATPALVESRFKDVKLIQCAQRTLAATARNIGARQAQSELLAFLDSDCTAGEHWLQTAVNVSSDAYCGVGGPIENANPDSAVSWAGYTLEFSDFFLRPLSAEVAHIPSGNLLIKKTLFDEVGGFPENFPFAQEDRYFSWLLKKQSGRPFLFDAKIAVQHQHRQQLREFIKHQQHIGRGGAEILKLTDLQGSGLIRRRCLMLLILPLLPFKKLTFCLLRLLRFRPALLFQYPALLPLLLFGMLSWGVGFAQGVYANNR